MHVCELSLRVHSMHGVKRGPPAHEDGDEAQERGQLLAGHVAPDAAVRDLVREAHERQQEALRVQVRALLRAQLRVRLQALSCCWDFRVVCFRVAPVSALSSDRPVCKKPEIGLHRLSSWQGGRVFSDN